MAKRISVQPGQRFDRLGVIKEVEPANAKRRVLCKCKCGETPTVDLYQLVNGRTKSCGCLGRENLKLGRNVKDLTGQTFGRLKVLRRDGDRFIDNSAVWVCECKCGNILSVPSRDLVSGNTKSCGCAMQDFAKSLTDHNMQHHTIDGVFVPLLRQKVQNNSSTGVKGVSVRSGKDGRKQYVANITVKGKRHYLGIYSTLEQAIEARKKAEKMYHKPYLDKDLPNS